MEEMNNIEPSHLVKNRKKMRSSGIRSTILVVVLVNVLALCIAHREVRTLDWVLKETSYTRLCSTKKILTVNGMFPGPAIHLYKGERLKVNVHNQGSYGVTIHWHGVGQPRNPWSDGPEYVAQCPIKVGANFTYEIILGEEEGTLWWHAHSDWSRATVHGPIFVYPKLGVQYPYAKPHAEIPIILGSWFKGDVMQLITDALASGGETNSSDAFTINGQPGDTQPCSTKDMFKVTVQHGKTYLLRIINAVMNEEMFFKVANHKLLVVGIDAAYVKPISTSYIMITPGQTMDVLLVADQPPAPYYIASRAYAVVGFSNATTTALLRYSTSIPTLAPAALPALPYYNNTLAALAFTRRFRALNDAAHPVHVPKTVHRRIVMTVSVGTVPCGAGKNCSGPNNNRLAGSLNNATFANPKTDVLQAYWKHLNGVYKTDFPDNPPLVFNYTMSPMSDNFTMSELNGTRVIVVEYNTSMEIVFQGTNVLNAAENHPMHLHGYSFYQVGWGLGNFNDRSNPKGYNLVDPPEVNTVGVPMNGWTAIRFTANNPGVWFMHCHLERHASWGMDTVMIVKNGPTRATSIRPPSYINPC